MATAQQQVDTRDLAALLAGTDEQDRVDQLAYEAERLIPHNLRVGGVYAAGLVSDLLCPTFENELRTYLMSTSGLKEFSHLLR